MDGDDALATSNSLVICRWLGIIVFPQLVVQKVDSISLNVVLKQGIAKQESVHMSMQQVAISNNNEKKVGPFNQAILLLGSIDILYPS